MSALETKRGVAVLNDPRLNRGTAFGETERDRLGLRGLLPPRPLTQDLQVGRVLANLRAKPNDVERYIFLTSLQERNEALFFRVATDHLTEVMPVIYTPTVGEACLRYGHIFRKPRGLFVSIEDRGRVAEVLGNWPERDVRIVVVTDGERILGLGDLGANGMAIPVGKLALYTACAGVDPAHALPITLDVGTENETLLADPLYVGLQRRRVRGPAYDALVAELMSALEERYPGVLVQFEDFGNTNAFRLLHEYRDRACAFNDDIQGTAAAVLAGLLATLRVTGGRLSERRLLFLGAGEAGIGIANLVVAAMVEEGLREEDAQRRCWFVDSQGLVVKSRRGLAEHKLPYAHDAAPLPDLLAALHHVRPNVLLGVSGKPRTFTREVAEAMGKLEERPVVFALSNPTSQAECTAEEAYRWTGGRALFASGSPFGAVTLDGRTHVPGQANNAYVFPGLGLGVVACKVRRVTDEMFLAAARALAEKVTDDDLARGCTYPSLARMHEVSFDIALAVARVAYTRGLTAAPEPSDLASFVRAQVYDPGTSR